MKYIITILTVLGLAGAAFAGCGKTTTSKGELKAYDADAKSITVKGADKAIKLTPSTEIKDKDGKAIAITELVGKKVEVVDSHGKAETVTGV